jgi:hypothetical protein
MGEKETRLKMFIVELVVLNDQYKSSDCVRIVNLQDTSLSLRRNEMLLSVD